MIEFTQKKFWFSKNFTIIKNGEKLYKWPVCFDLNTLVYSGDNIITIKHNSEKKAMIDFEDRMTGEFVYRCEINPLSYTGNDWVVDTQV